MLPSTTLNTHMLTFKSSEGRDPLPLTSKRAQMILAFLSDINKPSHFHLLDDTGKFKEAIPRGIIGGIKEIEHREESKTMRWICDCGKRNYMHVWPSSECECKGDRTKFIQNLHSKLNLTKTK